MTEYIFRLVYVTVASRIAIVKRVIEIWRMISSKNYSLLTNEWFLLAFDVNGVNTSDLPPFYVPRGGSGLEK